MSLSKTIISERCFTFIRFESIITSRLVLNLKRAATVQIGNGTRTDYGSRNVGTIQFASGGGILGNIGASVRAVDDRNIDREYATDDEFITNALGERDNDATEQNAQNF